ncbi:hypothetical protein [Hansschlegelia sp.]|uniref:hypothetical protein n=1 Tax=Hansschlegelia sp. TaxID=2041892 RepID=UPI002C740C00|nr:hypothetical protein [Hansschlegelia sp.]HVI28360.1 hypothetical protein [Hansschlegelia sp.]
MALVPNSVWPRPAAPVTTRRVPAAVPVAPPAPPDEDSAPPAYGRVAAAPCPPAAPTRRVGMPAAPAEGLTARKKLSDAYGLWRACLSACCRRAGFCQADLGCACLIEQRDKLDLEGLRRGLAAGGRAVQPEEAPLPGPARRRRSAARRKAQRYSSSLPSHL